MKDKKALNNNETSENFMLKEYERVHQLWVNELDQSEQRVNYFLTVASAAVGFIIVAFQVPSISKETFVYVAGSILTILLLYGITILNRLTSRQATITAFSHSMNEIQNYFAKRDTEIATYLNSQKIIFRGEKYSHKSPPSFLYMLRGSIKDIMVLSNALICSGLSSLMFFNYGYDSQNILLWSIIVFVLSFTLLYSYSLFIGKRLPPWEHY